MVDHFFEITEVVVALNVNAGTVARTFLKHCVGSFDIPSRPLADNEHQFILGAFLVVCRKMEVEYFFYLWVKYAN